MNSPRLDALRERLPDAARDLRLNLGAILRSEHLSQQQLLGCVLAAAFAAGNAELVRACEEDLRDALDETALAALRSAHALMAMNNVYYRFTHLASNEEYRRLPARLRMQAIATHGVDKADFELWCLVVSAIHGCGACVDSHERAVREHGLSAPAVQDAIRIASVLHGVARTLDVEQALAAGGTF